MSNIRVTSREALLLADIMANLDSLDLNGGAKKCTQSIPQSDTQLVIGQMVSQIISASISSNTVDFATPNPLYEVSHPGNGAYDLTFDPFNNIPLATFSYHEIPFVDEDLLPNYTAELPCSPPPSYPSSEYPFQKPRSIDTKSGARVLVEARESMNGKFSPAQVMFTNYVHELLKSRNLTMTKPPSNTKWYIKDPHGICWPLKGERRNRKYHFENYLPPRLSGVREIRSNKDHLRFMALEANMIKALKICSPLKPRFSLPKRGGVFRNNVPSGLRHSCSLEDLVWEAHLEDFPNFSTTGDLSQ